MTNKPPGPDNDYLGQQAKLILSSFSRLTGGDLIEPGLPNHLRYQQLFKAKFCVVSHNTETDPVFNYANQAALRLFEMNWQDFTQLPSRLSAETPAREEREKLLSEVAAKGFVDDYQGIRVSASGKRFFVENAVVWNLLDDLGVYRGQAAALYEWSTL